MTSLEVYLVLYLEVGTPRPSLKWLPPAGRVWSHRSSSEPYRDGPVCENTVLLRRGPGFRMVGDPAIRYDPPALGPRPTPSRYV